MLELRYLPQPRGEEVEAGQAAPPVPVLVPLPDPSRVRVHERPDSNVVSGSDLRERTGMAVAADGPGRFGVRAAGQLFSLACQLRARARVARWATGGQLAGVIARGGR